MQKNRRYHTVVMRAAAILFTLVMLSSSMIAGRYARYATADAGADGARVAAFDVRQAGELTAWFSVNLVPGDVAKKLVTVTNNSEVALIYTIEIENKHKNLPLTFNYSKTTEIAPGEVKNIPVEIYWPGDAHDPSYTGKVDILYITLRASQMD